MTVNTAKALVGYKIRERRKRLGMTQAQLASYLDISAPYLNLMESNKRPVSAALLPRLAKLLKVELESLTGAAETRQMNQLRELASDSVLGDIELESEFVAEIAGRYPNWTQAILRLGRAYREQKANADALSDRLNRDPALGATVHRMLTHITSIRSTSEILEDSQDIPAEQRKRFMGTICAESERLSGVAQKLVSFIGSETEETGIVLAPEQLDDFIVSRDNYFPELEDAAEELRARLPNDHGTREGALVGALEKEHGVRVNRIVPALSDVGEFHNRAKFVAGENTLYLLENAAGSTRRFQAARLLAELGARDVVEALIDSAGLNSDAARNRAFGYLTSYCASAVLFPYDAFLQDATALRYDIELLSQRYDASFEQVAHRLVTLRRTGASGVPFAFLRSDPAGFVTKRFPLPGLTLPRQGNACPLWAIYPAFQTPGRIVRQLAGFPGGERYLFVARTVNKSPARFQEPDFLHSVMLMCDVLHADKTVYADGLNMSLSAGITVPVGPGCRLCSREECAHREEPSVFDPRRYDKHV